jgi:hypothetical protein
MVIIHWTVTVNLGSHRIGQIIASTNMDTDSVASTYLFEELGADR